MSTQSASKTILLVLNEGGDKCYWDLDCTDQELQLFIDEIAIYNDWIATLLSGKAPLSSYEDPIDAADYQKKSFRSLGHDYLLSVIDIENREEDDEEAVENYLNGEANMGSMSELRQMFLCQHGQEEFYLGYKILPISEIIFKRKDRNHC